MQKGDACASVRACWELIKKTQEVNKRGERGEEREMLGSANYEAVVGERGWLAAGGPC